MHDVYVGMCAMVRVEVRGQLCIVGSFLLHGFKGSYCGIMLLYTVGGGPACLTRLPG